jgi:hypothetical protein
LLEEGKIDLVEGRAVRQALEGIERAPPKLSVLTVMHPNSGLFVVRADSTYRNV